MERETRQGEGAPGGSWSETRDGMRVDWQVPIVVSDGNTLRADVYRPQEEGRYPVIFSHGVYAKGLPFRGEVYAMQWNKMIEKDPSILEGSTNDYQAWEVTDPERWVPHGYAVVRVDSRGTGWSPGRLDPFSPREIQDACETLEWAGTQSWSNGKVGVLGISYYAVMGWMLAARQLPHLAAFIAWEGFTDYYRGPTYHGGILSEFLRRWQPTQLDPIQYGRGERAMSNPNTGQSVAGPETLDEAELERNRADHFAEVKSHPLADEWHRVRSADLAAITVPFLSAANWGGQGIHPTGNFNGFVHAASRQKWLEVHGDTHWTHFYTAYGRDLQKRFFDHFLKGEDNGWDREPPVQLNVRYPGEKFLLRKEWEWPLARTRWTPYNLHADLRLGPDSHVGKAALEYQALGDGLLFRTQPFEEDVEITGPAAAKLFVSSSTTDADLFVVLRLFDPEGREVTFEGSTDPNTPLANGWLRASHRALDPVKSRPWQPHHPHDRVEPLVPGRIYELDVEIWPTCVVVPAGYRLAVSVRGKDYEYEGDLDTYGESFYYATRGTGGMTHNDPDDRPSDVFGGTVTLHTGPRHPSHVLLPVIP